MQEHLYECQACATRDVWVRRSLLALQVLPSIEPSAGFHKRLYERLGASLSVALSESLGEQLPPPPARLQLASSRGR